MRTNFRMRSVLIAYLLLMVIVTAFPSWALAQNSYSRPIIPEYFLRSKSEAICVLRGNIGGIDTAPARKTALLEFVNRAYLFSHKWTENFVLAAVDYNDYRYFHVVLFRDCSQSELGLAPIRGMWNAATKICGQNCSGGHLTFLKGQNSLVADLNTAHYLTSPIAIFEHFRNEAELSSCVIQATAKVSDHPGARPQSKLYRDLELVRLKYRMSILDIYLSDDHIYFLFSRMCENRRHLFDLIREFVSATDPGMGMQLTTPDFHPDISEYHFAETGR